MIMIKRRFRIGLVAGALVLTGWLTAGAATTAAAEEPAGRDYSVAAPEQECIYKVLTATLIEWDGGGSTWLQPGAELYGPNDLGPINVYSYAHARRGWVYRDYFNLQIVGCDP
jgi:hypothetical protein